MGLEDEADDLDQEYRRERKEVEALDLESADADDDFEVVATDGLDEDDLVDDEEEVETVEASISKKPGRIRAKKPEDKPFSDYVTGVKGDDDWGAEAAGSGEIDSRTGRDSGPLEGEEAERQIQAIDARRRTHRQPTGNPPPSRRSAAGRKTTGRSGKASASKRSKARPKAKAK